MSDLNEKPAACPFCKAEGAYACMMDSYIAVICEACNAEGPPHHSGIEAIAAWNRRAPAANGLMELRARIKEMQEAAYTYGEYSKEAVCVTLDSVLDKIDELAPAAAPIVQPVGDVVQWIRNHYQDYPNVDSLCEALSEVLAAPVVQAEQVGEWDMMVERIRQRHACGYEGISTPNEARMADIEHLLKYISSRAAPTSAAADAKDAALRDSVVLEALQEHRANCISRRARTAYVPDQVHLDNVTKRLDAAIAAIATSADEVKS